MCKIFFGQHIYNRIKKRTNYKPEQVRRKAYLTLKNVHPDLFEARIVIGDVDVLFRRDYRRGKDNWVGVTAIRNSRELKKSLGV